VCIVDSGVDLNPDTASQVVFREALDGGDPGDVSPDKHGTLMAMMAAAPVNGWGMVGAAPGAVKIVSVRVEEAGEGTVAYSAYERGIDTCKDLAATFNIKSISLSLAGTQSPNASDGMLLGEAVDDARAYGLDVVAAVGNDGGAVSSPASYPPVAAVGATDGSGRLCAFSNHGPGLDVVAPGCGLDAANPTDGSLMHYEGTSEATAITSAVIADVRGYRPDLTVDQTEALLSHASSPLDATALFRLAGLAATVRSGTVETPSPPMNNARTNRSGRRLALPAVRLRAAHTRVSILVANRHKGLVVRVEVYARRASDFNTVGRLLLRRNSRHSQFDLPRPGGAAWLKVGLIDPRGRELPSRLTTVRVPSKR
jgi:hypothetical protein